MRSHSAAIAAFPQLTLGSSSQTRKWVGTQLVFSSAGWIPCTTSEDLPLMEVAAMVPLPCIVQAPDFGTFLHALPSSMSVDVHARDFRYHNAVR